MANSPPIDDYDRFADAVVRQGKYRGLTLANAVYKKDGVDVLMAIHDSYHPNSRHRYVIWRFLVSYLDRLRLKIYKQ